MGSTAAAADTAGPELAVQLEWLVNGCSGISVFTGTDSEVTRTEL